MCGGLCGTTHVTFKRCSASTALKINPAVVKVENESDNWHMSRLCGNVRVQNLSAKKNMILGRRKFLMLPFFPILSQKGCLRILRLAYLDQNFYYYHGVHQRAGRDCWWRARMPELTLFLSLEREGLTFPFCYIREWNEFRCYDHPLENIAHQRNSS